MGGSAFGLAILLLPGAAAAAPPRAITLEQALSLAGTSNLELRASEKEVERTSADARSAMGLLGPRLSIDDNGSGFDSTTDVGGLGSRLIDLLAQQVNGTVTTCSVPGEGTHVELLFKDPSPAGAVAN